MDNSMENMLGKLQGMQAEIARVQEELGSMTATAESGGGMVKVTANGRQEIVNITIEAPGVCEGSSSYPALASR